MDKTDYDLQLRSIFSLAALVRGLKIAQVLNAMNRAESVAPIVDPTLWLRASRSLQQQRKIVEAALRFQRVVKEVAAEGGG